MGKLSEIDKHSPVVETGQPNKEQSIPPLKPPRHEEQPIKKEIQHEKNEEHPKTGTR